MCMCMSMCAHVYAHVCVCESLYAKVRMYEHDCALLRLHEQTFIDGSVHAKTCAHV